MTIKHTIYMNKITDKIYIVHELHYPKDLLLVETEAYFLAAELLAIPLPNWVKIGEFK